MRRPLSHGEDGEVSFLSQTINRQHLLRLVFFYGSGKEELETLSLRSLFELDGAIITAFLN